MALIEATDLVKTYAMGDQAVHALDGVTLSIEAGEFVAVMGASGSGKSTLMNIRGCLDRPTSGHYRLAGEAIDAMSGDELAATRNKRIGFVFQQFNLLPRTSAVENVELPMIYAGIKPAERRARALASLERVGLAERAGRLVGQDQLRRVDERARDRDALLLAAGKLGRRVPRAIGQADARQAGERPFVARGRLHASVDERQLDVLARARAREQVELLEHEADAPVARCRELVAAHRVGRFAREPVLARRRPVEAAEDVHQRALARAGSAHHGDELARFDRQRHAVERMDDLVAHGVGLDQIDGLDKCHAPALPQVSGLRTAAAARRGARPLPRRRPCPAR